MNFTTLIYMWSFLALIPLILVYFLKVKPIKKTTTAFFLWQEIIDQKKASQLFHKLKDMFSLLILLLAFLLICTALLNPVRVNEEENKDLLILIDNSLSMSGVEKNKSRLSIAQDKATEIIKGMGLNRNAVLATVSNQIQYIVDKTNNLTLLKEGVASIGASLNGLQVNIFDQMSGNSSILDNYRVILLTDGSHEQLNEYKFLEVIKVGEVVDNIGITGFDIQRLPGSENLAGIFLKLFNGSTTAVDVEVKLALNEKENLFKIIRMSLNPGFNLPYTEAFKNVPSGKWFAVINKNDSLVEDNIAYAVLPEVEPIRVQIKSENKNYFLVKCIKAFEDFKNHFVIVETMPDVLLTDNQEVALATNVPCILFGTTQSSKYWLLKDEVFVSPILLNEVTENHRIMRYMKAETLKVKDARNLTLAKGVLPILIDENQSPILFKINEIDQKMVVLNFDLHRSDFFLNVNFPILVHNICQDLASRTNDVSAAYQVGDYVSFSSNPENIVITTPSGVRNPEIGQSYGPLLEKGFYQLTKNQKSQLIAVGVSPEEESNLNNAKTQTTLQPISSGLPISYYLVFVAISLVLLELILYHRRKVG